MIGITNCLILKHSFRLILAVFQIGLS